MATQKEIGAKLMPAGNALWCSRLRMLVRIEAGTLREEARSGMMLLRVSPECSCSRKESTTFSAHMLLLLVSAVHFGATVRLDILS